MRHLPALPERAVILAASAGALAAGVAWWPLATMPAAMLAAVALAAGLPRAAVMLLASGVLLAAAGISINASERPGRADTEARR